jgi:hypothetical protein
MPEILDLFLPLIIYMVHPYRGDKFHLLLGVVLDRELLLDRDLRRDLRLQVAKLQRLYRSHGQS